MQNSPEWMKSTPRLIAVVLTIALVYLTINKIVEAKEFVAIISLVFGYFFGSRGSEAKNGKTESEIQYQISDLPVAIPEVSQEEMDENALLSAKYSATDDSSTTEGQGY